MERSRPVPTYACGHIVKLPAFTTSTQVSAPSGSLHGMTYQDTLSTESNEEHYRDHVVEQFLQQQIREFGKEICWNNFTEKQSKSKEQTHANGGRVDSGQIILRSQPQHGVTSIPSRFQGRKKEGKTNFVSRPRRKERIVLPDRPSTRIPISKRVARQQVPTLAAGHRPRLRRISYQGNMVGKYRAEEISSILSSTPTPASRQCDELFFELSPSVSSRASFTLFGESERVSVDRTAKTGGKQESACRVSQNIPSIVSPTPPLVGRSFDPHRENFGIPLALQILRPRVPRCQCHILYGLKSPSDPAPARLSDENRGMPNYPTQSLSIDMPMSNGKATINQMGRGMLSSHSVPNIDLEEDLEELSKSVGKLHIWKTLQGMENPSLETPRRLNVSTNTREKRSKSPLIVAALSSPQSGKLFSRTNDKAERRKVVVCGVREDGLPNILPSGFHDDSLGFPTVSQIPVVYNMKRQHATRSNQNVDHGTISQPPQQTSRQENIGRGARNIELSKWKGDLPAHDIEETIRQRISKAPATTFEQMKIPTPFNYHAYNPIVTTLTPKIFSSSSPQHYSSTASFLLTQEVKPYVSPGISKLQTLPEVDSTSQMRLRDTIMAFAQNYLL